MNAPHIPTGTMKTFGAVGPKYEVGRPIRQLENGDWLVEIVLLESRVASEAAEYPLGDIPNDPDALQYSSVRA